MSSKRFKKLPKNTTDLPAEDIGKILSEVKKIVQLSLMSLLI